MSKQRNVFSSMIRGMICEALGVQAGLCSQLEKKIKITLTRSFMQYWQLHITQYAISTIELKYMISSQCSLNQVSTSEQSCWHTFHTRASAVHHSWASHQQEPGQENQQFTWRAKMSWHFFIKPGTSAANHRPMPQWNDLFQSMSSSETSNNANLLCRLFQFPDWMKKN